MFKAITHHSIFVPDQEEALAFYRDKLGLEVSADVDLGVMRWLTLHVPGDEERHLLLEVPGPPAMDQQAAQQALELISKGGGGLALILTTDDCRATYEQLRAKGVEFTEEPTERFYGVDSGLRDPFGNHIRITQPAEVMGDPSDDDPGA